MLAYLSSAAGQLNQPDSGGEPNFRGTENSHNGPSTLYQTSSVFVDWLQNFVLAIGLVD
jgi:hypothetical protein